jgi:hypothetical protein
MQLACAELGAAIFLCNGLEHELQIDCQTVADYAQYIKDTQGQEFDTRDWDVIVRAHGGCVV